MSKLGFRARTAFWHPSLTTTDCCEAYDEDATVTFMYPPDVERFLEAVLRASRPERPADVEIESLYNRISREDDPEDGWQWFRRHRFWRLEAQPREYGALSQGPERFADVVEIGIAVTVTLPRADLPEAVAAMRAHNLSRGRDVGLDDYRA